jgi:hypothetical protein
MVRGSSHFASSITRWGRLSIAWSSLLLALSVPAAAAAAAMLPVLSPPIDTWSALTAAVKSTAGKAATLTLSPSFTMAGYDGTPQFIPSVVTIEGHGATFDAAGKGSFFFVIGGASLTVHNLTMKNVSCVVLLSPSARSRSCCCRHTPP